MSRAQRSWYRVVYPEERDGYEKVDLAAALAPDWTQDLLALGRTVRAAQALGVSVRVEYQERRWDTLTAQDVADALPQWCHDGAAPADALPVGTWATGYPEAWRWGRVETPVDERECVGISWRGKFVEGLPVLWVNGWCCRTPHPVRVGNVRVLTAAERAALPDEEALR